MTADRYVPSKQLDSGGQLDGKVAVITDATAGIGRFDASVGPKFRGTYLTVQRALPLLNDAAMIVLVASNPVNAVSPGPTDNQGFANFARKRGTELKEHLPRSSRSAGSGVRGKSRAASPCSPRNRERITMTLSGRAGAARRRLPWR